MCVPENWRDHLMEKAMFFNSTSMVSMALAVFAIGSGAASARGTM